MPERLLHALPEPAMILRCDGRVAAVNDLAAAMFGSAAWLLDRDPASALGDIGPVTAWLADDGGPAVIRRRLQGRRQSGVPIVVDLSARRSGRGEPRQALCLLRELSEDRLTGEAQRYFDIAFEHAPIGMALFNTDGRYIRVNSSLCAMLGRSAEELIGGRDQELTHPDDREADVEAAWRILEGELDTWQCEKRFLRPDGGTLWVIANLTFLRTPDGHPLSWVGQFQDITRAKVQEQRLKDLADRDSLTGLFNRRRLEGELDDRMRRGHAGSLLIADLDRFKQINDAHGHRAGDHVLVTVASLLRDAVRETDTVARMGGDEFAILLDDADDGGAQALAGRIADVISAQRFGFDVHASISASIGVASFGPGRDTTPTALLAGADMAMYQAKRSRPSRRSGARSRRPPAARRTTPR